MGSFVSGGELCILFEEHFGIAQAKIKPKGTSQEASFYNPRHQGNNNNKPNQEETKQ
jgi:hypothetical protein